MTLRVMPSGWNDSIHKKMASSNKSLTRGQQLLIAVQQARFRRLVRLRLDCSCSFAKVATSIQTIHCGNTTTRNIEPLFVILHEAQVRVCHIQRRYLSASEIYKPDRRHLQRKRHVRATWASLQFIKTMELLKNEWNSLLWTSLSKLKCLLGSEKLLIRSEVLSCL